MSYSNPRWGYQLQVAIKMETNPQHFQRTRAWRWLGPSWWRHQMETFSALLTICAGNSPVPGEFPTQRPVTRSFDVFFDLRLNKPLSKQSWGWWFETLSRPLYRHCNDRGPAFNDALFLLTRMKKVLVERNHSGNSMMCHIMRVADLNLNGISINWHYYHCHILSYDEWHMPTSWSSQMIKRKLHFTICNMFWICFDINGSFSRASIPCNGFLKAFWCWTWHFRVEPYIWLWIMHLCVTPDYLCQASVMIHHNDNEYPPLCQTSIQNQFKSNLNYYNHCHSINS